ncbi:MAG: ABC transporter ATP-binding protein [Euryarchaeota archaeon]|nr:ABC transporter ATP-binding protein [Euryarchaeota archaeon]MDE1836379.1 ABC transporter ATP-binding protein [Euryarchaeota archaeon]MDE1881475.1 ABC transporter ATP-binding protein [Euryarchaeota archaeon]MDE2046490.1 ABC transporter ATP-binding protein [Thermoplasmata archaeon]
MLEISGLSKQYPTQREPALRDLSLSVHDGEIVGFVGLNGAGKTTAIRVAAGVALPSSGAVRLDGFDIVAEKIRAASTLGWVPEFPNFEPQGRALQLLEYFSGYHRMEGPQARDWCRFLLARVGLEGHERERVGTFSQGMKKRFALAAALLSKPKNLLLDELLNGLDPQGIRFSRNLLLSLRHQGCAILLSSHILTEIEQLADRIAFVHQGRLIRLISRGELEKAPGSRLRVKLSNPDSGALDYLSSLGKAVSEGSSLVLDAPGVDPAEVNQALVQRGYRVADLHTEREDLEAYFFRLIEEAR